MPNKQPVLNFIVDPELLERIDDYRFRHRYPSRAAAVKWLIEWALGQDPQRVDQLQGKPKAA